MDRNKVIEILGKSELHHANDAVNELPQKIDISEGYTPASHLLRIYQTRAKALSEKSGEHARQLLDATNEFISNLQCSLGAEVICISTNPDSSPHYLVFITNTNIAVGCLKVVSQLNVSEEQWQEWQELWKGHNKAKQR